MLSLRGTVCHFCEKCSWGSKHINHLPLECLSTTRPIVPFVSCFMFLAEKLQMNIKRLKFSLQLLQIISGHKISSWHCYNDSDSHCTKKQKKTFRQGVRREKDPRALPFKHKNHNAKANALLICTGVWYAKRNQRHVRYSGFCWLTSLNLD